MNKKIRVGITLLIITIVLLIILTPINTYPQPHSTTADTSFQPLSSNILAGKITPSGILFIILDKKPMLNEYCPLTQTLHDPNILLMVYSPSATNLTLNTQIGKSWNNQSFNLNTREITQIYLTLPLTRQTENLTLMIQGVGYHLQEQLITPAQLPFYSSPMSIFAYLTILTTMSILFAFGIALITLKKTKYFPPIKPLPIIFLVLTTIVYFVYEFTSNYYGIIQTPYITYELPLIAITNLIFLSYIPAPIQRGILLRFLDDRSNGEIYTDIMPILSAEAQPPEHVPNGWRASQTEFIDSKSYKSFILRLLGIHTHIIFLDGEFPDKIAQPLRLEPQKARHLTKLKRFTNLKRNQKGWDYGYLLAGKNQVSVSGEPMPNEVKEIKISLNPTSWIRKQNHRFLQIPLSSHHSSYIEEFLAGIQDKRIEGYRIEDYKQRLANKEAAILSGTFLNDTNLIKELGIHLGMNEEEPPKTQPPSVPDKKESDP